MDMNFQVQEALRGKKEAFVTLIKHSEVSMYRIARSMLHSDSDCADAIQESILKAYNSLPSLREPDFFRSWLIRILMNECHNILKRRKKVIPIPITEVMTQSVERGNPYALIELKDAVNSLPGELRVIVTLYYFEDLPLKDISEMLHTPVGTIKSRLSRARTELSQLLGIQVKGVTCRERN